MFPFSKTSRKLANFVVLGTYEEEQAFDEFENLLDLLEDEEDEEYIEELFSQQKDF